MDKYKKKTLNFVNPDISRTVRNIQKNSTRNNVRHKRLSMLRGIVESGIDCGNKNQQKGPKEGNNIAYEKPCSRAIQLTKWREERMLMKQLELKSKKPVFKIGHVGYKPPAVLTTSVNNMSIKANTTRSVAQDANTSKAKSVPPVPKAFGTRAIGGIHVNKTSGEALGTRATAGIRVNKTSGEVLDKRTTPGIRFNKPAVQVTVPTLIPRYKAASQIPSLQKNTIPKSFPPNKPVEQKSKMTARIFGKGEQKTVKGNAENSFSKMREEKKLGESRKENIPTKQNPVETTSILNSECSGINLNCDISCIKPTNRKSFAPENFMFLPPAGVCSFNAFENLPTVIYEKRKLKWIVRTSTPRKQTDEVVENKPSNVASGDIKVNEDRKDDDTSELLKDIPCSDVTESEIYITEILHSEETVTSKGMTENENVTEIGKYNAMAEQNSISVENVVPVHEELKDNAAAERRVSLRGKMQMLDTISEGCESDSSSVKSKRKSTNLCNSLATPNRPRRSLRLAKIFENNHSENCLGEPSGTNIKKDGHSESVHHGKLEQDFEQLHLESVEEDQAAYKASGKQPLMELNVDFIDFKNEPSVGAKSRKISLLYTPEKARRSTRLSIKDDLITFSPDL